MNRRQFIQFGTALAAAFSLRRAEAAPKYQVSPSQVHYHPLYARALSDGRSVTPLHMGSYFPLANKIHIPTVRRPGTTPRLDVSADLFNEAQGFRNGADFISLSPNTIRRVERMVYTQLEVPHDQPIPWEDTYNWSQQEDVAANSNMRILGDWWIPEDEVVSISGAEIPDTPVDWQNWQDIETSKRIGDINDERGTNRVPLYLRTHADKLYIFPDEMLGFPKTMNEICPAMSTVPEYEVQLRTVFPVIDERFGIPEAEIWAHIIHSDPTVEIACLEEAGIGAYTFIRMETLLARVPAAVRSEARERMNRETRVWPIEMEWQPLGGGLTQKEIGQVAMVVFGAIVIVAVVVLILSQPQFLILAAVAL